MKYKRILIKLSGEMLGRKNSGFSVEAVQSAANEIKTIIDDGLEVGILVGGGNIMRARYAAGLDRLTADFMGMTATVINALGLKSVLGSLGIDSKVLSAVNVSGITEPHVVENANRYLSDKKVVIFAGGTGSPYVTTDTAAALRALEIKADVLIKATKVDGVYSSDPESDKQAKLFTKPISYKKAIKQGLRIMDSAALSILAENNINVIVFNFNKKGNLKKVIEGKSIGTIIGG